MNVILEAKDLCKSFGETKTDEVIVLKDVSLKIEEGEFVAIMGQSGSGKSTLLYNISGMDKMTSGQVIFEGEDISCLSEEKLSELRLNKMGFIFQQSHLLKNMSIRDNVILPGYKAVKKSRQDISKRTDELMKKVGIESVGSHDITKVSGGQLQRAAVCRALINNPRILFGDEPTGALNSGATSEVMNILNEINQEGTTILLVTHDAKVAARADRVIFLADGNIDSEFNSGRYEKMDNLKKREERLTEWLNDRGF
jgi:putative ABC transport system ATP-binding protein